MPGGRSRKGEITLSFTDVDKACSFHLSVISITFSWAFAHISLYKIQKCSRACYFRDPLQITKKPSLN